MRLCEYGCGREATYQFKNGKWCCESSWNKCPSLRKINSKKNKAKKKTKLHCKKISDSLKNRTLLSIHGDYKANIIRKKLSVKAKRSWIEKYGYKTTKKLKKEQRLRMIGLKNPMFGQTHSEENKEKISKANKGKVLSKKTKQKISIANKGNFFSSSHRKNLSKVNSYTISKIEKKYLTFSKVEEMRYKPDKEKIIQVHCKNNKCSNSKEKGGWFTPTKTQLSERIRQIENGYDGSYFYCCDECKQECPLFNMKSDPNKIINKEQIYTNQEYNIWRKEVFNRNGYYCEYCDEPANTVHHSRPQKLEPGFALDPDFGVVCCEKCHYKYGHKTGTECSTGNLAKRICK